LNNFSQFFLIQQRYHLIIILIERCCRLFILWKNRMEFSISITYCERILQSVKRRKTFIFYYFSELCSGESYREAIKKSICMDNMLSSVAFDGRSLGSWCTLIRKCFSLLRTVYARCISFYCLRARYAYVHICVCLYVCLIPRAHTLPVINNANGFRQQCQGIMHKHGCANKIQKNCSISRLRIAYLPEPQRGCRSLIMYIFSPTSDSTSLKAKQCVRANQ